MRHALDKSLTLGPVDQFDDAVVAQLVSLGQLPRRGPLPPDGTANRQIVLPVSEPVTVGRRGASTA
jgi:hypothetical protein